jgi:hypothetical protein
MPGVVFFDILWDLCHENGWVPRPGFRAGDHEDSVWFTYDHVVQDYYRAGYPMPFPLSRAEFGKELANFAYHLRHRVYLCTERKTNNFGTRYRRYKLEPLGWWKPYS